MTSSIISDFLGEGLAASIPTTLDIAAGVLGLYYATDSVVLYAWNGSSFDALAGTGSVTSVIAGAGLNGGTITVSGTLSLATTGAGRLVGNPGTAAAVYSDVTLGAGLTLNAGGTLSATGGGSVTSIIAAGGLAGGTITTAGTVSIAAIAASSLFGNSGTASAVPAAIAIGSHLGFATGTLDATGFVSSIVAGGGLAGGTITSAGTITLGTTGAGHLVGNPGTATAIASDVTLGAGLTLTVGGTLSATNAGSVTSIVAGPGLAGGTITSTGTVSLATSGAGKLIGNPGTAAAIYSDVTVGSGLTLSVGGTLSATGGSSITRWMSMNIQNLPPSSQTYDYIMTEAGTLSANGGNFQGLCVNNPTASWLWQVSLVHSGTVTALGTVTINTSGAFTAPTYSATAFAAGNVVRLTAPGTQDLTGGNVTFGIEFVSP